MKRKMNKRREMMEKCKEIRKRQNANKGFKEWLKVSLFKAKQETKYKQMERKEKKKEKLEKQKFKERKKIEAEISFK